MIFIVWLLWLLKILMILIIGGRFLGGGVEEDGTRLFVIAKFEEFFLNKDFKICKEIQGFWK
jgi:hypothetical protein